MGWIKRMNLKSALFTMMFLGLALASLLSVGVFYGCIRLSRSIAPNDIMFDIHASPPVVTYLPKPSARAIALANIISILQIILPILIFTIVILLTSILFYRIKLKDPLRILKNGAEHIMENDLDFTIPPSMNRDELGELCTAFEKMRESLLVNNQTLWRQAEERKRLNAAFAHDLRNPITVLKGTVKLLQNGIQDEQTIDRLESYTLRIEQYIESMSNIQRLEQMPVQKKRIACGLLYAELADTVSLLAPTLSCEITVPEVENVEIDHGLFMTVAENLIANAARFSKNKLWIHLEVQDSFLLLSVIDDGPGLPEELIRSGPKPFGKMVENGEHFGMGLYSCQTICIKHGGKLILGNKENVGAEVTAYFL